MTQRVKQSEDFQLPPGQQWWMCRYQDGDKVSEILFTDERAPTWYLADKAAGVMIGFQTYYKVTLYEPKLQS